MERYSALGQPDRIRELARQIIASRPDVILPLSGPFIDEVMAVTTSIPMVGAPTLGGRQAWRGLTEILPEWCRMQDWNSGPSAVNCYRKQRVK